MNALWVALLLQANLFVNPNTIDDTRTATSSFRLTSTLFEPLLLRNIGPTTMGGRIMDLAVYEKDPRIFYVATASGGLWKTENSGTTLKPVFEKEGSIALGAATVCQTDPNLVWVGTGEGSSRNSCSWGDGVYKSTDGGKTWQNMGLKETHHITKILIHPKDPNIVYVGALGHLWGTNPDRGVFKTTDGGKTWQKVFYVNDSTGVADLRMNPSQPEELLAAMWTRVRYPWNLVGGGPENGIYKTTNGGKSWRKIQKGLPTQKIGRIGLSYFKKNPKIVFATVEYEKPVKGQTPLVRMDGGGTFRSTDAGETWSKAAELNPRPFYFSTPAQDPTDENRIYVLGVNLHISDDKGQTFKNAAVRVHSDWHEMWINPNDSHHILVGTDGGVYQSRDRGQTWDHINGLSIGQFYAVGFDYRKPYWVYGGLQDNNAWGGPTQSTRGSVQPWDFYTLTGGDGFYTQVDPNDWTIVYTESQGGNIVRVNQRTGENRFIRPREQATIPLAEKDERYRFNWQTPFFLSPHNSRTIYIGGNKLFKSVNRGDTWKVISPDLTTNDKAKQKPGEGSVTPENTGAEAHCTIVALSESPLTQGLLWAGTDDGNLWISQDDGISWSNVAPNIPSLPKNSWCSRITASKWVVGRAYACFDNHRINDYKPYVYVTEDFGKTWRSISGDLALHECAYVIREGDVNPELLFLGTERSLRISLDRGQNWLRYESPAFPTVPVHDLAVHPREHDLIIGTHGRGIYTLNISPLEQMRSETLGKEAAIFKPQSIYFLGRVAFSGLSGDRFPGVPNSQPGTQIIYFLKEATKAEVKVVISDAAGKEVRTLTGTGNAGLNMVRWDGRTGAGADSGGPGGRRQFGGPRLADGDYRVTLKVADKEWVTSVRLENVVPDAMPQGVRDEDGS